MALCRPPGQVAGGGEVPPVQAAGPPPAAMDAGDWRTQLQYDSRVRIVHQMSQPMANSMQSNSASGRAPSDQGVAKQSQRRQLLILQNMMLQRWPHAKRKIQSKSPWPPITRSRAKKLRG